MSATIDPPETSTPVTMTLAGALQDVHVSELLEAVVPDLVAAMWLGEGHPQTDALVTRAWETVRACYDVGDGEWPAWAARLVFDVLVGVAGREVDDER